MGTRGCPVPCCGPRACRRHRQPAGGAPLCRSDGMLEMPGRGTDRIDAGVIAWYAEARHIAPQPPASDAQQRLTALVTRLRQLTEFRTAQLNQRRLVTDPKVRHSFDEVLQLLRTQIRSLEGKIAAADRGRSAVAELDATSAPSKVWPIEPSPACSLNCPKSAPCRASRRQARRPTRRSPATAARLNGKRPVRGGRRRPLDPLSSSPSWCADTIPDFAAAMPG